mmetsp:Transcript_19731/g.53268  ORF Transcript_19731/g.53268 Transcript_19731/m.53268 type:complete len:207 (+) Transcript_19731:843-1463(+)
MGSIFRSSSADLKACTRRAWWRSWLQAAVPSASTLSRVARIELGDTPGNALTTLDRRGMGELRRPALVPPLMMLLGGSCFGVGTLGIGDCSYASTVGAASGDVSNDAVTTAFVTQDIGGEGGGEDHCRRCGGLAVCETTCAAREAAVDKRPPPLKRSSAPVSEGNIGRDARLSRRVRKRTSPGWALRPVNGEEASSVLAPEGETGL